MSKKSTFRAFAVVPAAGRSRRMGRQKLLLPWGASTVIQSVVQAWMHSDCASVVVVIRKDERQVQELCRDLGAEVVSPVDDPPEMKDSVGFALRFIAREFAPSNNDAWLLAPADLPRLSSGIVNRIIAAHDSRDPAILVPVVKKRRAHPVLFPWSLSTQVDHLGEGEGVNMLLQQNPLREIAIDDQSLLDDLDTPADYERMRSRHADDA